MRFRGAIILLLVCVSSSSAQEVDWTSDLDSAQEMARSAGRPVFLHFYADWCVPCKKLDKTVFADKSVTEAINEAMIAVKINVDKYPKIAKRYGVKSLPTDVYLNPNGETMSIAASPMSSGDYLVTILQMQAELPTEGETLRVAALPKPTGFKLPGIRQPEAAK